MRLAALLWGLAIGVASMAAWAQGEAGDPVEQLRACAKLETAERLQCLERLSRDISPPPAAPAPTPPAAADDGWLVSETTSPVDYTPVIIATRNARGGSAMQLFINCRGGRVELALAIAELARGEVPAVSYRLNDGALLPVPSGVSSSGSAVAFGGDAVRLLASLPEEGTIAFRVSTRQGTTYDGEFTLNGLKAIRTKVAAACSASAPVASPPAAPRR